jgi:hypothetical protein
LPVIDIDPGCESYDRDSGVAGRFRKSGRGFSLQCLAIDRTLGCEDDIGAGDLLSQLPIVEYQQAAGRYLSIEERKEANSDTTGRAAPRIVLEPLPGSPGDHALPYLETVLESFHHFWSGSFLRPEDAGRPEPPEERVLDIRGYQDLDFCEPRIGSGNIDRVDSREGLSALACRAASRIQNLYAKCQQSAYAAIYSSTVADTEDDTSDTTLEGMGY